MGQLHFFTLYQGITQQVQNDASRVQHDKFSQGILQSLYILDTHYLILVGMNYSYRIVLIGKRILCGKR